MDRHEAGYNKPKGGFIMAVEGRIVQAPTAAQFLRLVNECMAAVDSTTSEALPALVLAENRLDALAGQGRGASHLDIIEVRALVREAGSDKEPWK